jgi:hypothetical protein
MILEEIQKVTVFTQSSDVVMCDIGDSKALLNLTTSQYFKLNPTAAIIWSATSGEGGTLDSIVSEILNQFDVTKENCEADVSGLLKLLCEAGLLESHAK